ncbi:LPXTG cell wall anchor domain-containing protein [Cellulomonas sp. ATA003]|uniref:LPXTG cell wall anchor domain-containing protein n=1 Tax=Cellulomonas sp. ATA003 TaxID=3073064 RepID=UPI00287372A3|nr:LPXTG cell wall anchor domain-containing protein [Cellulomonas sp. ATA003]WNB85173.1 LPXTG cell wall anchor domain-containing protein [Cellulomonas sp. ATA003]
MRRALTVVAATMFAVGGFAGTSASAATLPLCEPGDGYVPGETCQSRVAAEAECPDGSAEIVYSVEGATGSTVDLTWNGTALPGQPLSGTLTWPAGNTADATLVFATTPATTVTVDYPCEESGVLPAPETPSRSTDRAESGVLAETGATGLPIALGGGALIVGGAAAVMLARRNRQAGATE